MLINLWNNNLIQSRLKLLKTFLRIMKVRPVHIILPAILSFITAGLEGLSLLLLVPLCRGMVSDLVLFRPLRY